MTTAQLNLLKPVRKVLLFWLVFVFLTPSLPAAHAADDPYIKTVWLTLQAGRLSPYKRFFKNEDPLPLLNIVWDTAEEHHLPPELILAVIHVESHFDRFAVSRVGAIGLMQVMPFWLPVLEQPEANLLVDKENIELGCTILRRYLDRESGNFDRALQRYNGSLGESTYSDKVKIWWDYYYF
ncbi:lytic transglycosylase domain-containing protein [Pokkaliibacter sp. CJK22405]|uniref:lytic transglycosylase domain-containing protein n=1 Tax=Pokkaliibacter sp. CJK22405 TaxID=3384615 RepID=UPI0039853F6A